MRDPASSRPPSPAPHRDAGPGGGSSRSPEDPSDAALVAGMAGRDVEAARALYRRLSPLVYSLAMKITGLEEDAEEVLVDAFSQAWAQAERYDPARATVAGWIMNIARSRALDSLRSRRRWEERRQAASGGTGSFPDGPATDPEREAMKGEERDRLHRAIRSLAPDQRRAVELAYFGGLSQSEIAERLGQPLGTIKTRIRLAMNKIRRAFSGVENRKP